MVVRSVFIAVVLSLAWGGATAAESVGEPGRDKRGANPLKNVYFGEQHLHTRNSFDAFTAGNRQTWEETYRYNMGEAVTLHTSGEKIQRRTPYDFTAITDHSEYFAVLRQLTDPKNPLSKSEFARGFTKGANNPGSPEAAKYIGELIGTLLSNTPLADYVTPELRVGNWEKYVAVANKFNKPGRHTALIAYEWTSIPDGQNMHRNVFFRDDKGPAVPFSSFDSIYPEDLWTYLEIQRTQGIDTFAIPHNGNVSGGWMYARNKFQGDLGRQGGPIDARYARRQQLNEPLTEILQTKGSSDTHPWLSPNDEFADFELFPNFINIGLPSPLQFGFFRQGLATGMSIEAQVGYNPYKMGVVAGADSHSGYSNNEEFNFHGSHGSFEDTPKKRLDPKMGPSGVVTRVLGSAGTTAVWAEENTRAGIFDAMKAKETYGTSGTLIRLRFFGGWGYPSNLTSRDDFVKQAYDGGVPMGQDLPAAPAGSKAPIFAVWALKDPESGNLDRIQIIKVWNQPRSGYPTEKIYEVALADGRTVGADGTVPPIGNTVDVSRATYTNSIGDTQLSAVWTDPDFDPKIPVAYYVRVLEIPTPRWSTYDAVQLGVPPVDGVPGTIQERAWSSPIWYAPGDGGRPAKSAVAAPHGQ